MRFASAPLTLSCSYRVHAYTTRNGAPTFTQPEQPAVEIFLDYGGGSPSWVIQSNGSTVYAMLPNSMDPSYNSFPNIAGSWVVARPGTMRARSAARFRKPSLML